MTIRVAQITDIHLTAKLGTELYGVDTAVSLGNIINQIKNLSKRPDVIIATGDLAEDGSKATYRRLQELLADLEIPVYLLPGNHDNLSAMRASFNANDIFYVAAKKIGGWGFIFVNSKVEGQSHGCVSSSEIAEIKKSIVAFDGLPILLALHHTPSIVCPSIGCQLENSKEFTALLNEYSNVKAVIAGHTHCASEINAGGHIQFTTPSTFAHASHAQLGEQVNHDDFWASHKLDESLQGFRILDLSAEGTIQSDVHWLKH